MKEMQGQRREKGIQTGEAGKRIMSRLGSAKRTKCTDESLWESSGGNQEYTPDFLLGISSIEETRV